MEVRYARRAQRDLEDLNSQVRVRVEYAVARLAVGLTRGRPLTGSRRGLYRLRAGDWRIIYRFLDSETLAIETIGHRREVYRQG
ncbi:MAG: type II toxin-antitoxin system RelE/ParE family toxin [Chloroflexi bacterium]|nr:type II toxin-antitoxin system RelE/ParE family toxin [Chloroflexota bacterium]